MSTSKLEFKDTAYLETAFPASKRVYVHGKIHPSVRVPLREISIKDNPSMRVYDTRGPWGDPGQKCDRPRRVARHPFAPGFSNAAIPWNTRAAKIHARGQRLSQLSACRSEPGPDAA